MNIVAYKRAALAIRRRFLQMHFEANSGHLGTGLSTIDLLAFIYGGWLLPADRFILSKGHGASALYATLNHAGHLSDELLRTYYKDNTTLPAHPAPNAHPHIPVATGSLGHGLPVAVGLAYTYKYLQPSTRRVVCMLSDGECNEGSVWEAAMMAAHHRLNNLTVVIDANGLQGFGTTREVCDMEPFTAKWHAFRFAVQEINGHDFAEIARAFSAASEMPRLIVARTVKGKGVSFMENKLEWHYLPLQPSQSAQALAECDTAEKAL